MHSRHPRRRLLWIREAMGVGRSFSRGGGNGGFSRGSQKDFCRWGPKVAKFYFNHWKLRRKSFFAKNLIGNLWNFKIQGSLDPPLSPTSDANAWDTNLFFARPDKLGRSPAFLWQASANCMKTDLVFSSLGRLLYLETILSFSESGCAGVFTSSCAFACFFTNGRWREFLLAGPVHYLQQTAVRLAGEMRWNRAGFPKIFNCGPTSYVTSIFRPTSAEG